MNALLLKKSALFLCYLISFIDCFSQVKVETQLIKYSSVDSQISLRVGLKSQLENAFNIRTSKTVNLVLTSFNKYDLDSISTWLRIRNKQHLYQLNISTVISKYIGETEKNLDKVFAEAHKNNWILFFDEADALFGKRSTVKDSHDKYANQEVAYILKKIKLHNGIVLVHCKSGDCTATFLRMNFKNISVKK